MTGLEQVPWPCSVQVVDGVMTVERNCSDSGRLLICLEIPEYGELVLSTATLPERETPYHLPLELVRGTVNRLNNQLFLWSEGGLKIPQPFSEQNGELCDQLAALIFGDRSGEWLNDVFELLDAAVAQIFELSKLFADFVIELRIQHDGSVKSAIGFILNGLLDQSEASLPSWINCISLSVTDVAVNYSSHEFDWTAIESNINQYGGETRLIALGPMIDFARRDLPAWLNNDDTFDLQRQTAANLARGYARHLLSKNQLAYVAAGLNGISQRSRSFPQQLQITVDMLEAIENVRTDVNTLVSFDQPWGERLAWSVGGSHAMHIADTLLRHGLHISSFGLEVNLDYWPHGSLARDPLHWVDLIDHWSQFGLPLFVILSAPMLDVATRPSQEVQSGAFPNTEEDDESDDFESLLKRRGIRRSMSSAQLYNYLEAIIRVLISKPIVNGILWRQWQDDPDLRFIGSGLVNQHGELKPIGRLLEQVGNVVQSKGNV